MEQFKNVLFSKPNGMLEHSEAKLKPNHRIQYFLQYRIDLTISLFVKFKQNINSYRDIIKCNSTSSMFHYGRLRKSRPLCYSHLPQGVQCTNDFYL